VIGRPVNVEPKVGVGGTLAAAYAAKAKPDGYTIYLAPSSTVMSAAQALYKQLPYDPMKDFVSLLGAFKTAFILLVPRSSPYTNVAELTEAMRKKGDKASYGTATLTGKVAAELYKEQFGLSAVEIPYKSGILAMNDMASGLFDFYFTDTGTAKSQIGPGGKLRPLCVTSRSRITSLPEVPGAGEQGLQMDFVHYGALHTPAGTPKAINDQLISWMNPIVSSEEAKKFLATLGYDQWLADARGVDEMLERETRNWAGYVKLARIQPE
jgi:tripartite-type tricarboxylate transporter receptor subunit TctC